MSDEDPGMPAALPIEVPPWRVAWDVLTGGAQWIYRFENNYGASVINGGYGGERGLYELAVIWFDGSGTWAGVEDTPVTRDVVGWLTVTGVAELLVRIAALPRREGKA